MIDLSRDGMTHVQAERQLRQAVRAGDVRYRLYAARNGIRIAQCRYTACQLECDSEAEVKYFGRVTMAGNEAINWETDLLHPVMTAGGIEYPFVPLKPVAIASEITAEGILLNIEAHDESVHLQENSIGSLPFFPKGMIYTAAVAQLLDLSGFSDYNIAPSPLAFSADREDWEESDYILTVANQLLKEINYTSLAMDRQGILTAKKHAEPSIINAGISYAAQDLSVILEEKSREIDSYKRPNWFKGIALNPDMEQPLTFVYQIDDPSIPISVPRQGIIRREIVSFDSVPDLGTLQNLVIRHAMETARTYEHATFRTAIMPHHEVAEVLTVNASGMQGLYEETGWSIDNFASGGTMTHNVRRAEFI
jgi:hypothetical protein